jgi:hypothetical protein
MPVRGPTLTFDARYVEFAIQAWQERGFAPMASNGLIAAAKSRAEECFTALNAIGLQEEHASDAKATRAVNLLKNLKLAKQTMTGPSDARVAELAITSLGHSLLTEALVAGGIRPAFVRHLVASSPELKTFLQALGQDGPLLVPGLSLIPGAPRKGAAYTQALEQGLSRFLASSSQPGRDGRDNANVSAARGKKPTPAQLVKQAQSLALMRHAAGELKSLDTLVSLASTFGLVWEDVEQVNPVVTVRSIGSAATSSDGTYSPNILDWNQAGSRFIQALVRAHASRADGSGFATVESMRGALGQSLHISPSIADALFCKAREEGDRGAVPVQLYFVENEDLMYAENRHPLVWRGHAFDFIEVMPLAGSSSVSARANYTLSQ